MLPKFVDLNLDSIYLEIFKGDEINPAAFAVNKHPCRKPQFYAAQGNRCQLRLAKLKIDGEIGVGIRFIDRNISTVNLVSTYFIGNLILRYREREEDYKSK
ncbi:MAG: hypothetical protein HKN33_14430 [Pyrinomonadaceae bacterium]|nr:hypothetical protein [Pyrinomonadaceae bacterium]